jgi:prepilin-type N-terminal cleavage/methylation domain-containing protein
MLRLRRNQQGDTLVEVLIAIAIVSLILTTAYAISNKNTLAIQSNQERIQAQHLVEAQIEALRAQDGLVTSGDCFGTNGTEVAGASVSCTSASEQGSGATYTVSIQGPVANIYTVKASWSDLTSNKTNGANVTMYYRLN